MKIDIIRFCFIFNETKIQFHNTIFSKRLKLYNEIIFLNNLINIIISLETNFQTTFINNDFIISIYNFLYDIIIYKYIDLKQLYSNLNFYNLI